MNHPLNPIMIIPSLVATTQSPDHGCLSIACKHVFVGPCYLREGNQALHARNHRGLSEAFHHIRSLTRSRPRDHDGIQPAGPGIASVRELVLDILQSKWGRKNVSGSFVLPKGQEALITLLVLNHKVKTNKTTQKVNWEVFIRYFNLSKSLRSSKVSAFCGIPSSQCKTPGLGCLDSHRC